MLDTVCGDFGYQKRQRATIVLDVVADLEMLRSGLTKEVRKKVRKAERQDISIVEDNSAAGLNRYYEVRLENARRNGLRLPSRSSILAAGPI